MYLCYFVVQFQDFSSSACQHFDIPSLAWKLLKFKLCVDHRGRKPVLKWPVRHALLVRLIDDHSCPFVSKKSWKKSFMVQNQFKVQRVMARCTVRRGRPPDRKNDRKTTGFTKPLRLGALTEKIVAMGSEDFWFWARLWRWRRFEQPCNGAETKPKTEKTAAVRPISSHRYRFYGNALMWKTGPSR